jgi:hypothetical protein
MRLNVAAVYRPNAMFVTQVPTRNAQAKRKNTMEEPQGTGIPSGGQHYREIASKLREIARMPVSRGAARDTRSCLRIRTQSRRSRREERVGWLGADNRLGAIRLLLLTLIELGLRKAWKELIVTLATLMLHVCRRPRSLCAGGNRFFSACGAVRYRTSTRSRSHDCGLVPRCGGARCSRMRSTASASSHSGGGMHPGASPISM